MPSGALTLASTPPYAARAPASVATVLSLLRPWSDADAPALRAASAQPDLRTQLPALAGDDEVAAYLLTLAPAADRLPLVIEHDGRLVGAVAITHIEDRHRTGWVSYWLLPRARGLGLARRAVATVATWAFDVRGVERLELGHRTANPASCAVAVAAGFRAEGVERGKLLYDGVRHHVETHARLGTDPVPDLVPLSLSLPTMPDQLRTARLRLRALTVADLADVQPLFSAPGRAIGDGVSTPEQTRAWLARRETRRSTAGVCWYGLRRSDEPHGPVLGNVGLFLGRTGDEPEIGIEIATEHRGQGLATEATRAVVAAGHTVFPRIWATVRPWNTASLAVLRHAGFVDDRIEPDERGDLVYLRHSR